MTNKRAGIIPALSPEIPARSWQYQHTPRHRCGQCLRLAEIWNWKLEDLRIIAITMRNDGNNNRRLLTGVNNKGGCLVQKPPTPPSKNVARSPKLQCVSTYFLSSCPLCSFQSLLLGDMRCLPPTSCISTTALRIQANFFSVISW